MDRPATQDNLNQVGCILLLAVILLGCIASGWVSDIGKRLDRLEKQQEQPKRYHGPKD